MKITIIGSWREKEAKTWGLHDKPGFEPYCLELGRQMAIRQHVLIVGNNLVDTADRLVVRGYEEEGSGPGCEVYDNTGDAPIPQAAHIKAGNLAQGVIIIGGASGSYVAGLALLHSPRRFIPVACFGGAARRLLPELLEARRDPIEGFSSEDEDFRLHLAKLAESVTDENRWPELARMTLDLLEDFPRILIIHGRGKDRDELKDFLHQLTPPVQKVIVMKEIPGASTAAPRKFERLARAVDAAIAIVTPDDIGAAVIDREGNAIKAYELGKFSPRARENVWLEIGWFWGRLGRDRLLLLRRGDAVIPLSDLGGVWAESYT